MFLQWKLYFFKFSACLWCVFCAQNSGCLSGFPVVWFLSLGGAFAFFSIYYLLVVSSEAIPMNFSKQTTP